MSKKLKKLLALLLTLVMLMSLVPTLAYAANSQKDKDAATKVHVYTDEENAAIDNDVFAKIQTVKNAGAVRMGGIEKMTEADYVALVPQVAAAVMKSSTYKPGTLQKNGNFLVWQTTVGIPCCYDPRMEAELHNTADAPSAEEIARIEADAASLLEDYTTTRGGSPTSTNIGLIQPYWESSSSYNDSSFLNYSPYYKTTWQNLYGATGGQGIRYSMSNATVDNIASTMTQCGLVIFDSHGTTDYSGSNSDYTSRANSSYLCLITNSGVTSTDTAAHTGTYGTYYDCMKGSGYAYVNGQCIANHMSGSAPHSLLYMGICLGMATDRMEAPLRAKGVEVVYGYSQSVSFKGELQSVQSIMGYIKDGMEAGAAIEQSQTDLGCQWDPAYPNYTESQAKSNKIAFPVVASSEDTYPGHGNVDCVLTAHSTWKLFGQTYTVTATSNNTNYGTVSVDGYVITATPKTGYYASGYTVTSGTATVVQDGNTFTVTPSTNCTVRINFAAKTAATVNYMANGVSAGSASSYVGDTVTLPTTAATEGDYTFIGWVANTVNETTTKPTYYKPGATYTVSATSVTLYALYSRSESNGTGETVYQLADTMENGGKYILVSSESVSGTTGYAVGNTIVASNHYLNAVSVTINDETCTASSSNLAKVLWVASGSSANGFSLYNEAVGKYMGLDSSEYIYPSSTALAWKYTDEGYLDNQTDSEGYYYLSYDATNGRYTTSKQGKAINLYKAVIAATTYYTTTITTQTHTHSMTYVAAVAATCAADGHTAYYYCSGCGKYYSDANGNNEITLASTVIPATGNHTYGSYTSNNNGTHSHYCSVCNKVETENCTYTSVVTAPTAGSQGYTTYTCTVCGYSYVGDYTDPTGYDYTVTFSVPAGVAAVAAMTCHQGNTITLPAAGTVDGWTFAGWVTAPVAETSTKPTFFAAGASYGATADITLYALYTRTDGTSGETVYQLATAPVNGGTYIIVDSNTISGTTGYAVGNTIVASNHYLNAVSVTISDNTVTAASPAGILWVASGNATSGYTFYNEAVGKYMGLDSSEYLYPSATALAWLYTSEGYLNNQTDSEGYYYLSFDSTNTRYTTNKSGKVINLYEAVTAGTAYYTTSPVAEVPHEHTYGAWTSNNNGTHSHYCSECNAVETENCTYNDVVTAPTATEQGYTTHTCTVCGYSFVDSYVPALGEDPVEYTVTFSVPAGVTAPAAVTCEENGTITLPTAGAPSGYTFLGWVVDDYNNVAAMPAVLTGTYTVTASITLKALYSKTVTTAGGYELLTSVPTDWTGDYVITCGNTAGSMYVLKGLSGTKKYESTTAGGTVALASTGMTLNGNTLTGVTNAYKFNITAVSGKYAIKNASTGTYLASRSSYLYSYTSNSSSYCRWSLAMTGSAVDATNAASRTYTHLALSTSNYFMLARYAASNIYFWKLTDGGSSTVYTTVID